MNDIKIIKSLEDSGVIIDGVTETVKEEIKKKTRRWISWNFASTFRCFIFTTSNLFSSKRYKWKSSQKSRKINKGQINENFLDLLHPLNNFEITNCFNYELRFNGVFSRNNLLKIKDGPYVINLSDKNSKRTHWVSLFIDKHLAVYFNSFGIEYIPQKVLNRIKGKSITHNIFRRQINESIMCRFFCIAFIEYMLAGKTLLDYTYLFSPNDYKKNDKIVYKYFKDKYGRKSKSRVQIKEN